MVIISQHVFCGIPNTRWGSSMASTVGSGLQNQAGLQLCYITHFVKMAMIIIVISSRIPLRCPFVK